jgi:hypothetical protein
LRVTAGLATVLMVETVGPSCFHCHWGSLSMSHIQSAKPLGGWSTWVSGSLTGQGLLRTWHKALLQVLNVCTSSFYLSRPMRLPLVCSGEARLWGTSVLLDLNPVLCHCSLGRPQELGLGSGSTDTLPTLLGKCLHDCDIPHEE